MPIFQQFAAESGFTDTCHKITLTGQEGDLDLEGVYPDDEAIIVQVMKNGGY